MPIRVVCLIAVGLLIWAAAAAQARGPWRADEANTQGWQLMTPQERIEHQALVRGFTSYEPCHAYQLSHHRLMEARARQMNLVLPPERRDFCAHLQRAPNALPRPD